VGGVERGASGTGTVGRHLGGGGQTDDTLPQGRVQAAAAGGRPAHGAGPVSTRRPSVAVVEAAAARRWRDAGAAVAQVAATLVGAPTWRAAAGNAAATAAAAAPPASATLRVRTRSQPPPLRWPPRASPPRRGGDRRGDWDGAAHGGRRATRAAPRGGQRRNRGGEGMRVGVGNRQRRVQAARLVWGGSAARTAAAAVGSKQASAARGSDHRAHGDRHQSNSIGRELCRCRAPQLQLCACSILPPHTNVGVQRKNRAGLRFIE